MPRKTVTPSQSISAVNWVNLEPGLRYPIAEACGIRWVPVALVCMELGVSAQCIESAAKRLSISCTGRINYEGKGRRSDLAIRADVMPFVLFTARPIRGARKFASLRGHAFHLVCLEVEQRPSWAGIFAEARNKTLQYQFEVEKLKVADRDRAIADLRARFDDGWFLKPGVVAAQMNSLRERKLGSKDVAFWRDVIARHRRGESSTQIAAATRFAESNIKAFLSGNYKTRTAVQAMSLEQFFPKQRPAGA